MTHPSRPDDQRGGRLAPDGDVVVVEAPTAEEALAAVHDQIGTGARIVGADKVRRGGLWGFFPKEVVQLTVATTDTDPEPDEVGVGDGLTAEAAAAPPVSRRIPASARPRSSAPRPQRSPLSDQGGLEDVLVRLAQGTDEEELGLGTALRRHLGVTIEGEEPQAARTAPATWTPPALVTTGADATTAPRSERPVHRRAPDLATARANPAPPPAPSPTPQPADPDAVIPARSARPRGGPSLALASVEASAGAWSRRGLLRLGLSDPFIDAVLQQRPADDAEWVYAFARVIGPLCRPLPTGPDVVVGTRAERLAKARGIPLVRMSTQPRGDAPFAVATKDTRRGRRWIADHRGDRWLHLVVGGSDWRGLLFDDPLAVSWVGSDAVGEAVRTAYDLGLVLGHGLSSTGGRGLVRCTPIDVAVAVRDELEAHR